MKTSLMRVRRRGVSATFSWLTIVMHVALAALMVFLLNIIAEFVIMLETAMMSVGGEQGEEALRGMTTGVMAFGMPEIPFLEQITIGMIIVLVLINAFAIVGSEGSLFLKIFLYMSILLFVSGVSLFTVPSLVQLVWSM
jgi:archaellum biogenesis protein FlaJ (TadC family)